MSNAPDRVTPWVELRTPVNHPFVYRRMVRGASEDAAPGSTVAVYDKRGDLLGYGHYNPRSQIALRVLTWDGSPADETFWRTTLERAVHLRADLLRLDDVTDAYRLVHAEGDGLSGLVVDRYGDALCVEIFSLGMYHQVERIVPILAELCQTHKYRVQVSERVEKLEGFRGRPDASPDLPREIKIQENGVRFRVSFATGHKTGFFCDQRDNRLKLSRLCRGANVLDVCCYTGGFGIHAAVKGGAKEVTCVDLDEEAVAMAKRNADLNQARVQTVHADAFSYMRQMQTNGRAYDAVVLDPPKLIFGRDDQEEGRKKYFDLNVLAVSLVRPGGLLVTCSCSGAFSRSDFIDLLRAATHRNGRRAQVIDQTGAGPDHPVRLDAPEGEYLKAVWLRVI